MPILPLPPPCPCPCPHNAPQTRKAGYAHVIHADYSGRERPMKQRLCFTITKWQAPTLVITHTYSTQRQRWHLASHRTNQRNTPTSSRSCITILSYTSVTLTLLPRKSDCCRADRWKDTGSTSCRSTAMFRWRTRCRQWSIQTEDPRTRPPSTIHLHSTLEKRNGTIGHQWHNRWNVCAEQPSSIYLQT